MSLALFGGEPVWTGGWPSWPQVGPLAEPLMRSVLTGGRWAISGGWTGHETLDQGFSRSFAAYIGTRHCATVDHGSSALLAALMALGVGWGDEVIVPGLTWVACASAVLRVNAVPVLVDISSDTLCLSPDAVEAAITPNTRAIIVVHLYSAMADMEALEKIAVRHGIPLIEDCAQAHGAEWGGRRAGSLGAIGTFSMQQGKVLTCGEGGAIVTSNDHLAARIEQIRGDGRRYSLPPPPLGRPHLVEESGIQGMNLCLSEFQAAILLDGLDRLDEQTQRRACNAQRLDHALQDMGGYEIIRPHRLNTRRAYYHYAVRISPEAFLGCSVDRVCLALEHELGLWVHPPYSPLNDHPLYRPAYYSPLASHEFSAQFDPRRFPLPEAHRQVARTILIHHAALLADDEAIGQCIKAFAKVRDHASRLSDGSA